jgi:acyl-coenzyme A synthetase/AMP-(fatty) acid ligase
VNDLTWPALLARGDDGAPLLRTAGAPLTRGDVREKVGVLAAMLEDDADRVLACESRPSFVLAVLALWARGARAILPPNHRPATVAEIAGVTGAAVVDDAWVAAQLEVGAGRSFDAALLREPMPGARALATVFTSGSTAAHRRIDKAAAALLGEAAVLARTFALRTGDRVLTGVPPHHLYGLLFGVLVPLVAGASIVCEAPLHAEAVAAAIGRHGATVLVSTPAQLRAFDVLAPDTLAPLRRVFSSGAALPSDVAGMMRDRFARPVTEILGSTETGGVAWRVHDRPDLPFRPLSGVSVAADADGRMLVDSPFLPPDAARPWPADDRIALGDDGFVHLGRLDDVVKIAGRRVALGDVERRVRAVAGVGDVAVLALPAPDGRGEMLAVVVAGAIAADVIRSELARFFDAVVVPRKIVCVDRLPREDTGKLMRSRLLALLQQSSEPNTAVAPHEPDAIAIEPRGPIAPTERWFELSIPPDLAWLSGHFPDEPVLPAVAQLDAIVLPAVASSWAELGAPRRMARLKFRKPIAPGDRLELHLVRVEAARVDFELHRGAELCASGTLEFDA